MASDGPGRVSGIRLTSDEEEELRTLAARPDIYEAVAKSIAPSIYGSTGEISRFIQFDFPIYCIWEETFTPLIPPPLCPPPPTIPWIDGIWEGGSSFRKLY